MVQYILVNQTSTKIIQDGLLDAESEAFHKVQKHERYYYCVVVEFKSIFFAYCEGEMPTNCLNAVLNVDFD